MVNTLSVVLGLLILVALGLFFFAKAPEPKPLPLANTEAKPARPPITPTPKPDDNDEEELQFESKALAQAPSPETVAEDEERLYEKDPEAYLWALRTRFIEKEMLAYEESMAALVESKPNIREALLKELAIQRPRFEGLLEERAEYMTRCVAWAIDHGARTKGDFFILELGMRYWNLHAQRTTLINGEYHVKVGGTASAEKAILDDMLAGRAPENPEPSQPKAEPRDEFEQRVERISLLVVADNLAEAEHRYRVLRMRGFDEDINLAQLNEGIEYVENRRAAVKAQMLRLFDHGAADCPDEALLKFGEHVWVFVDDPPSRLILYWEGLKKYYAPIGAR